MTRIYLICSAEAEGDIYRIAQGWYDSDLTVRGWRQTKALEKRFAEIPVNAVYTSDLYSACATASALYQPKGLTAVRGKELREWGFGTWEGKNWGNLADESPRQLRNFRTALENWYVDDAEMPQEVQRRMLQALRQIAAEHEGQTAAVVSHSYAIRLLLAELTGIKPEGTNTLPVVENTEVIVIEAEGGALRLISQGDTSHLEIAEYQAFETLREKPDFNTDMSFYLLRWIEYGELMAEAVGSIWPETGEERPFDRDVLLNDAALLSTTVGYVEQSPAGFLQMGAEPGWITLLCTHPGCRRVGLGTQLLGQAVEAAREKGGQFLRIALSKKNPNRQFFLNHGFSPAGELPDGRDVLQKNIALLPEFLSEA